jgi:hypothetical protein
MYGNISRKKKKLCIWDLKFSRRWLLKVISSAMWLRVMGWEFTDVSEERTASIFRQATDTKTSMPPFTRHLWSWSRTLLWNVWNALKYRCTFTRIHGATHPMTNTIRNYACWQYVQVGNTVHNWRHGVIAVLSALDVWVCCLVSCCSFTRVLLKTLLLRIVLKEECA